MRLRNEQTCSKCSSIVCNRISLLTGHPARLRKEGGCEDLSMDTMHLNYQFVLFGSEGSALTPTLFLLSPRIVMLCHCSSRMTKDHFLVIFHGTKSPLCAAVHLNPHPFIRLDIERLLVYTYSSFMCFSH